MTREQGFIKPDVKNSLKEEFFMATDYTRHGKGTKQSRSSAWLV